MSSANQTKFVVVAGGVISGVGKGVTTASLGKILKEHGYRTTLIKIDPYINFDAGTLRPTEHGELWVKCDGGEIDQDLGTYERFMNMNIPRKNNITTGQIYKSVIDCERRGEYLGQTVQFIPHITDEINDRIRQASEGYDVAVIEIGGTVGDYENVPFLTAIKGLELEIGSEHIAYMLVSYLPVPGHIGEMKTKPTQQAIRLLREQGISPDFIICRSDQAIDDVRSLKIERFAHISREHILSVADTDTVYRVPLLLEEQACGKKLLDRLRLPVKSTPDWTSWKRHVQHVQQPVKSARIAILGKYVGVGAFTLADSYLSVCHALTHAGADANVGVELVWIDASVCDDYAMVARQLQNVDGLVVPGGFGASGVQGKMNAIRYARENGLPYLGLCYGMQLAAIEFAREVCKLKDAHTTEVDEQTPHPIIDLLPWQREVINKKQYGGTMRLGAYDARVTSGSRVHALYTESTRVYSSIDQSSDLSVSERHRHRYELNPAYVEQLEKHGMRCSGLHVRGDGTRLAEYIELPDHPFFVATQAHPEFMSRFGDPHPLFSGLVRASARL